MNYLWQIKLLVLVSILVILPVGACTQSATDSTTSTPTGDQSPTITIENAWSRSTPEMMEGSGIVYMTINNNGPQADKLVASKSPAAAFSELHETSADENGVMRMRGVKGGYIDIPAGGSAELKPAGLHVMLIDLKAPLESGTSFPLTLKFEQAGEMTIDVPVMDFAPE
jgi:copper(I)-binding protein